MSDDRLYSNLRTLGAGVEVCLEHKNALCALIILYTALDTVGWLASESESANKRTFLDWADRYLLPESGLGCTAIDLYAARCGVLHTFRPESDLYARGEARLIGYAWGSADASKMERLRQVIQDDRYVTVHVQDLYQAWLNGLERFADSLAEDPGGLARLEKKTDGFFWEIPPDDVDALLAAVPPDASS